MKKPDISEGRPGEAFSGLRRLPSCRVAAALLVLALMCGWDIGARAEGRAVRAGLGTDRPDLAQALAGCQPGDTVLIADGTYAETLVVKKSGLPGRPIMLKAEHPRQAVFSRKGLAGSVEGSFLRLEGLVFDAQYGNASCVRARGDHVQFLDCEIRRAGTVDGKPWGDGLQLYDSAHAVVERCHVHHCLATRNGQREDSHGIRLTHCHDVAVRDCFIDLVSGDCLQVDPNRQAWDNVLVEGCKLSGGRVAAGDPYAHPRFAVGGYTSENAIDTKCPRAGRPRITVRNCAAYGFRGPIGNASAFNIKENCDAVIDRCTVYDSVIGLRLRAPAQVRVTNCVLYDNDTHCRYEGGIPRLHVYHCTFGPVTGKGRGFFQEQQPSPDLRLAANLFLGEKPAQAADPSNRAVAAGAFVAAARHDYHLREAVPAGDLAKPDAEAEVRVDRDGVPRGEAPDAGAYQRRAGGSAAPSPR